LVIVILSTIATITQAGAYSTLSVSSGYTQKITSE